jgi:hypothetical protein
MYTTMFSLGVYYNTHNEFAHLWIYIRFLTDFQENTAADSLFNDSIDLI